MLNTCSWDQQVLAQDEDHWKGPVAAPCLGKGGIQTHFQLWFSCSIQHAEVGISWPPLQCMPARCGTCRKHCCSSREGLDSVWRWCQGCAAAQLPGHWMCTRRTCQRAPARLGFLALHYTSKFSACKCSFLSTLRYFPRKIVESSCPFSRCSFKILQEQNVCRIGCLHHFYLVMPSITRQPHSQMLVQRKAW